MLQIGLLLSLGIPWYFTYLQTRLLDATDCRIYQFIGWTHALCYSQGNCTQARNLLANSTHWRSQECMEDGWNIYHWKSDPYGFDFFQQEVHNADGIELIFDISAIGILLSNIFGILACFGSCYKCIKKLDERFAWQIASYSLTFVLTLTCVIYFAIGLDDYLKGSHQYY
jgi:hypothetical protein